MRLVANHGGLFGVRAGSSPVILYYFFLRMSSTLSLLDVVPEVWPLFGVVAEVMIACTCWAAHRLRRPRPAGRTGHVLVAMARDGDLKLIHVWTRLGMIPVEDVVLARATVEAWLGGYIRMHDWLGQFNACLKPLIAAIKDQKETECLQSPMDFPLQAIQVLGLDNELSRRALKQDDLRLDQHLHPFIDTMPPLHALERANARKIARFYLAKLATMSAACQFKYRAWRRACEQWLGEADS
jgi:hypothetical protein